MTPHYADDWLTVYLGDCRTVLADLPAESVHCVVTSPPYWGLRDYGTATWDGGDVACDHLERVGGTGASTLGAASGGHAISDAGKVRSTERSFVPAKVVCRRCGARRIDDQLGLEATPEEYVANMVAVFREVRRVLRDDGTLWLNLGDSYWNHSPVRSASGDGWEEKWSGGLISDGPTARRRANGHPTLKMKDLVGIPWRVAFALQADGWYLRSDIIWAKPNPMPESVTDRPTKAHEYLFLLAKSPRYYFDADAVREPDSGQDSGNGFAGRQGGARQTAVDGGEGSTERWRASKKPDGWATHEGGHGSFHRDGREAGEPALIRSGRNLRTVWTIATQPYPGAHFATFPRKLVEPCIKAGSPVGGVVLDPFAGSGTTGLVAQSWGRRAILIDLSADYLDQALERTRNITLGLG